MRPAGPKDAPLTAHRNTVRCGLGAAAQLASPGCVARIVAVPALTIVTVVPLTVATAGVRLVNPTASPELAVAESANAGAP